jgi:hypothetical protein
MCTVMSSFLPLGVRAKVTVRPSLAGVATAAAAAGGGGARTLSSSAAI